MHEVYLAVLTSTKVKQYFTLCFLFVIANYASGSFNLVALIEAG